jgi:thioester reductase-like protein
MYFTSESKAALIASMNFDASVLEIFLPLLNGGTLVVMPESVRKEPAKLHQAIQEYQVTHIILSPVVLQNLPRSPIPSLQFLSFGGDTIDEQTADWWARHCRLFSLYGPTETTVIASLGEIIPGSNPHIIGKPLAGNRIYLLNHQKQPVPMGAVGEICIGGDGLARGYLNLNQLTLERFVMDPFGDSPYALMYLTGDLGRYLPDGTIEFLGRKDSQIKLRGFRIELGEIENRLTQFPDIQQVVCAMKGDGDNRHLAAYYVSNRSLDEEELRKHLSKFLPDYMVPSFFVRLAELPSSPNGKINRKALPTLSGKTSENPPRDGLESQIAQIWEEVLRFRGVGRDESFFRLGGNSLLAVRMQAEVRKRLNLEFSISQFYNAPTIEALAAGHQANHIQLAVQDAQNGVEISHPLPRPALYERPQTILLTGAKGFLGIFLLGELSRQAKKIYCLMRCSTALAGMDDLLKQSQAAGVSIDPTRIQVVPGDLAEPDLGLSSDWRKRLSVEVDAILHCGAFVHHLHNYQTMKSANVEGTKELLKLALEEKIKKFCFVSTISVASALDDILIASETIISNPPISDGGYILTKWVGEQLVAQCADRYGLPAIIARPGNITGCSTTGFSNFANNHFWLFVQGCLQLKAFPNMEQSIEMTPVDLLAQAIVALLMNPRNQSQKELVVANLSNPVTLRLKEFFSKVMSCGFDICEVPVSEWQRRLDSVGEGNGLSQIKEFYTGDLSGKSMPVEQSATLAALAAQRVGLNVNYDALIPIYMSYLQKNGFLKP